MSQRKVDENDLKEDLMKVAKERLRGFVVLTLQDVASSGHPDVVANGGARTSWWEVKFADPVFESKEIQRLTMLRLAACSYHASYIIYEEINEVQAVRIVHPKDFPRWSTSGVVRPGWDHNWVVEVIRRVHYYGPSTSA